MKGVASWLPPSSQLILLDTLHSTRYMAAGMPCAPSHDRSWAPLSCSLLTCPAALPCRYSTGFRQQFTRLPMYFTSFMFGKSSFLWYADLGQCE